MSVAVANLRHSVSVEQPTKVSDGQGGFTRTTWTNYYNGYADIAPASATERLFAFQKSMQVTHKITMRYRRDKTPTIEMRINYTVGSTTRYFQIKGVINVDERNRYITMTCVEGVGV